MNNELAFLRKRRTIRKFTAEDISEQHIEALLDAASIAPSRLDRRPLHYVLIRDQGLKAKLAEALRVRPYIEQAPVVMAVCADPSVSTTWELDASAAIENILLAATALGLGAAWVGSKGSQMWEQAVDTLHTAAGVPAGIVVASLVCIGHPNEEKPPYGPGEKMNWQRVHLDRWDNIRM